MESTKFYIYHDISWVIDLANWYESPENINTIIEENGTDMLFDCESDAERYIQNMRWVIHSYIPEDERADDELYVDEFSIIGIEIPDEDN